MTASAHSSGAAFAPGVMEILSEAHGEAPAAGTPAAPAPEAPRFLDGAKRSAVIPLEHPAEFQGKMVHGIRLKRMRAAEVAAFMDRLRSMDEAARDNARVPIFSVDDGSEDGVLAPDAWLDGLDDDDLFTLMKAAQGFLPRRFQVGPADASTPASGAPTAP